MLRKDPYERVLRTDPFDNWTTITLIVLSGALSTLELQGRGHAWLHMGGSVTERPWQLVTAVLLHGSYLHLAMNLYWTWQFGRVLEPSIGSWNLAWVTVVFAAGESAASYALEGPSIGLSGVGFAYFGLLWALSRHHREGRALLDERITSFFVLWFFICIGLTYYGTWPIANVAHGAGALLGYLAGWGLAKGTSPFAWQRQVWILVVALFVLGAVATGDPLLS